MSSDTGRAKTAAPSGSILPSGLGGPRGSLARLCVVFGGAALVGTLAVGCERESKAQPGSASPVPITFSPQAPALPVPTPTPAAPVTPAPPGAAPHTEVRALRGGKAELETPPPLTPGGHEVAGGRAGLVVSVEEQATRAGVQILEAGGNAVDAAVATAYALAVTHPSAGNLGGGGFMLIALRDQPAVAVDFRERAPHALTDAQFHLLLEDGARGPRSSAVPGSVAGLNLAEQRFGRLPLARVIAPAIALARDGHRVGEREALTLHWAWHLLRRDPAARRQFGTSHGHVQAGDWLVRADLARTLERIAVSGNDGFYRGETARAIVRGMGESGLIRARDLSEYSAVERTPLASTYRGYDVLGMPPPSWGGLTVAQILIALERRGAERLPAGSADELHLFAELARRAQAERRFDIEGLGPDPDLISVQQLRDQVLRFKQADVTPAFDPEHATPSIRVHPGYLAIDREPDHTTHLSVVDAAGNAVSCTTTLSAGFGAAYVVPGTGIVMNDSLAAFSGAGSNQPGPGRRMRSSMAPTLLERAGRVVAVLGSPGGETIPSTVVQVLRNLVDHAMSIDAAIEAPRVHQSFVPDELRVERSNPPSPEVLSELEARGHSLNLKSPTLGDANDIVIVDGVAYGHADSREGGFALAARPRSALLPQPTIDARR